MYLTEQEWINSVSSYKFLRRLDNKSETASLFVFDGSQPIKSVFEYLPLEEVVLKPFFVDIDPSRMRSLRIRLILQRHRTNQGEFEVTSSFDVVWKSRYATHVNVKFTIRPHAIFVLVPEDEVVNNRKPFDPPARKDKSILVPLLPKPLKTLRILAQKYLGRKSSRRRQGIPRHQFGRQPNTPPNPNQEAFKDVFDARYSDNDPPEFSGQRQSQVLQVTKISVNTPNFGRIKKRKLPVNPFFYAVLRTYDNPAFSLDINDINSVRVYYGTTAYTFLTPPATPSFSSSVYNKALGNLLKYTDSDITANIAQDVAQFGQLTSLIGGNAKKIGRSLKLLRGRNIKGAIEALTSDSRMQSRLARRTSVKKTVAQNWLEIQYGWKILLKEIDDLMKMIANRIVEHPPVRRVTARSHKVENETIMQGPFIPGSRALFPLEINTTQECKIILYYSVSNRKIVYAQQLGLLNPINLAWELKPFSFVADWALPIGPALETLSSFFGMVFQGGCVTQASRQWVNFAFDDSRAISAHTTLVKGGSYRRYAFSVNRSLLYDFPRTHLPQPKNPLSLTHALNGLALLTTAFSK